LKISYRLLRINFSIITATAGCSNILYGGELSFAFDVIVEVGSDGVGLRGPLTMPQWTHGWLFALFTILHFVVVQRSSNMQPPQYYVSCKSSKTVKPLPISMITIAVKSNQMARTRSLLVLWQA